MAGGQVTTSGQGSVTQSEDVALIGVAITGDTGFVSAAAPVEAALSGSESSGAAGIAVGSRIVLLRSRKVGGGAATQALSGAFASAIAGIPISVASRTPVGIAIAGGLGAFAKTRDRVLSGSVTTGVQGSVSLAGGGIDGLNITTEQATPEQIGLYLIPTRAVGVGSVTVRYRQVGNATWLPLSGPIKLLRISPTGNEAGGPTTLIDSFAGSIFDLSPGTQYDVELTHVEAGQANKTTTIQRTTRSLPAASGAANKTIAAGASSATIQTAFNGLVAGDVLQFADGTYTINNLTLNNSGTATPIYVRGNSRTGVILLDTTGDVLAVGGSNIVFEDLTIQGSSTDSGISTTSCGIHLTGNNTNVTVRRVTMTGVDRGVNADLAQTGALVYNCTLTGNNLWNAANMGTPPNGSAPNLTWNDDGIRLPGLGNCAWENTLYGFGDSFAVIQGERAEGVYFYRNRIRMTGDDSFEGDYATRNIGFYDNSITNCGTLLSLDPVYGGPLYCFRNLMVNSTRGPWKFTTTNTGYIVCNNTIIRTDGLNSGWAALQFNNGAQSNYSYCNNLLLWQGAGTQIQAIENAGHNPVDFTNNAYFPNGSFWWTNSGGTFGSLAAAQAGVPNTTPVFGTATKRMTGDIILNASNPFATAISVGSSHLTEYTTNPDATLAGGSNAKNAGIAIPGITDGFSGAAPDIGAIITGRLQTSYGDPTSGQPTWVSGLSTFTWRRLTNTAPTLAGSQAADPTHLDGITAFSGAAYDFNRRLYMFNGGGHGDGGGNGVFAVRVGRDTPDVVALRPDSASWQTDVAYYSDGRPSAAHTYGTLIYVPSFDSLMRFGNTASFGSGNGKFGTVDRFHLDTNAWDAAGTYATMPSGSQDYEMHTCRDDNDNVYESTWGTSSLRKWTKGTPGSWSVLWSGGAGIQGGALVFDKNRQRIVYFGSAGQAAFWNLSGTRTGITFGGLGGSGNAWVYCPSRDSYLGAFGSGGTVVIRECNPTTFNVTSLAISGTGPGLGASGFGEIHNRLQIDDTLGIVMVHANVGTTDLWAFKYK